MPKLLPIIEVRCPVDGQACENPARCEEDGCVLDTCCQSEYEARRD